MRFVATGAILPEAVAAAEKLTAIGIDAGVVSVPFVTALNEAAAAELMAGTSLVLTAEEHLVTGGLGGTVAEFAAANDGHPRVLRCGIAHPPPKVALDQAGMRAHHGIDRDSLVARAREALTGRPAGTDGSAERP